MSLLLAMLLANAQAFSAPGLTSAEAGTSIDGIWTTLDETKIYQISPDEFTVYDYSGFTCIESDQGTRADFTGTFSHVLHISGARMEFWDEGETVPVRAIDELPGLCEETAPEPDAQLLANAMASYFERLYATFEARGVARDGFLERLRALGKGGTDQFWSGLGPLLSELDDAHLFATNGKDGKDRRFAASGAPTGLRALLEERSGEGGFPAAYRPIEATIDMLIRHDVLKGNWTETANGKLVWGWLSEEIAYVRIASMANWTDENFPTIAPFVPLVEGYMETMVGDVAEASSIVLDLRRNRGGNDVLTRVITSYFLTDPARMKVRSRAGEGWAAEDEHIVSPAGNALRAPLYLLIDVNTVSGAEIMVMLLDENPRVTLIGETTRGSVSGTRWLLLPGGGFMGMPYQQTFDADGRTPAGSGISPDIQVTTFPDGRVISGYRDAIDRAVELELRSAKQATGRARP